MKQWIIATGLVALAGCALLDEDNIHFVGGRYYTSSYDNGTALNWQQEPEKFGDAPLLEAVYDIWQNSRYMVARVSTDAYFAFPLQAASRQEVQQKRLGPLSKSELNQRMLQLTGDSMLHPIPKF